VLICLGERDAAIVAYSHETVTAVQSLQVCCRRQSGKHLLGVSISHFDLLQKWGAGALPYAEHCSNMNVINISARSRRALIWVKN
jgi:hypothetical protein